MKKLKLNSNAFDKGEVLTRVQLKKVMGGDGSGGGPCHASCRDADMNVLSPEGGISVASCDANVTLEACTAAYSATKSTGCYC